MKNASDFQYLEIYDKLIQYEGFYDKEKSFIYEYGYVPDSELLESINQKFLVDGKVSFVTNLKGIFLDEEAFDAGVIKNGNIVKGASFSKEDFVYNNKINVMLGYNYIDYYEVGDEISVLYLGDPLKMKVKGFLEKSTEVCLGNKSQLLDSHIIIPSFSFAKKNDETFQKIHLSNKTKGFFVVKNKDSKEAAFTEFEEIIKEMGFDYSYIPINE